MLKKLLILLIIFLVYATSIGGVMAASDHLDLNIMSFNIYYGSPDSTNPAFAKYIVDNNIDIAFLQEVETFNPNYYEPAVIMSNLNAISNEYKYYFDTPHTWQSGLMLISKYPLIKKQQFDTDKGRRVQTAVVKTPNGYFRVFNIHVSSPDSKLEQCDSLQANVNVINQFNDYPIVVAGDFNIEFYRDSLDYKTICKGMMADYKPHTCFTESSCGISHQTANGVTDYLFIKNNTPIDLISGYIAQNTGSNGSGGFSDHFPLLAVIRINGAQFNYKYDANLDEKFDILDAIKVIQAVFGN